MNVKVIESKVSTTILSFLLLNTKDDILKNVGIIDFHSVGKKYCLVTNIFCVQQKKDTHTGS